VNAIIDAAVGRSRPVLLILALVLVAGSVAYVTIPKESDPDVAIPIIYVSILHEGISAEDAERLLVRPMEKELRSIEGVKEMSARAEEGHATVSLEFEAGFDSDQALNDVREKVDIAKVELPVDTDEPTVTRSTWRCFR
jgi:multidrug efflux pump